MPAVNERILEWARTSAGLSVEEAARALDLANPERLLALEAGLKTPSRPLLLRMAKQYRRPLLTFYLAEPPARGDRGQDFRTLPHDYAQVDEAVLDTLIRDLQARQALVKATMQDEDEQAPLPFIGAARIEDGYAEVARSIREALRFDLATYRHHQSTEQAFSFLRQCAEEIGIFVLLVGNLGSHHTAIRAEVFRGFAIADPIAPFVVVNDQDSKSAWSFTLLHEVAHLWLGTTGVSGANTETAIEQFCNDVASELLLPRVELESQPFDFSIGTDDAISQITRFAEVRHLSRSMVAYRLLRAGRVAFHEWQALSMRLRELWVHARNRQRAKDRGSDSGPNYYVVRRHRLGRALLDFARRNVSAGALSPVKAARVLGVKPRSVLPLLQEQHRGAG